MFFKTWEKTLWRRKTHKRKICYFKNINFVTTSDSIIETNSFYDFLHQIFFYYFSLWHRYHHHHHHHHHNELCIYNLFTVHCVTGYFSWGNHESEKNWISWGRISSLLLDPVQYQIYWSIDLRLTQTWFSFFILPHFSSM